MSSHPTLMNLLDAAADRYPGDALVLESQRLAYPELRERAIAFATQLHGLGVRSGDAVGVLMQNSIDYIPALLGANYLGAVAVPINNRFRARELRFLIEHADLTVLLIDRQPGATDFPQLISEIFGEMRPQSDGTLRLAAAPRLRHVVVFTDDEKTVPSGMMPHSRLRGYGSSISRETVVELAAGIPSNTHAMTIYTSGTTADPKGCVYTHAALIEQAVGVSDALALTQDDRFWAPLPFFHMSTLLPIFACWTVGAAFIGMQRFTADDAVRQLEDESCTIGFPCFETVWLPVVDHPRFTAHTVAAMRLAHLAATPERRRIAQDRLPHVKFISAYGSTEGGGIASICRWDDPEDVRLGSAGRALPGVKVRVVDVESARERGPGEIGEFAYQGPGCFAGYYKQAGGGFHPDGWFRSGDLGYIDEQGGIHFVDRKKDMLKVGGENVASVEVETVLAGHPAVSIAQVVPAPDARYGEVVAAFLQLRTGATLTTEEIQEYCAERIARYKVPRHVRFVSEWPMSGTKVKKHELRARLEQELQGASVSA